MRFEPHTLIRGSIHLLPVLHGQLEFAQLVVQAFRALEPRAIAVELPRLWGCATSAGACPP